MVFNPNLTLKLLSADTTTDTPPNTASTPLTTLLVNKGNQQRQERRYLIFRFHITRSMYFLIDPSMQNQI